jgi:hypothetical protein
LPQRFGRRAAMTDQLVYIVVICGAIIAILIAAFWG